MYRSGVGSVAKLGIITMVGAVGMLSFAPTANAVAVPYANSAQKNTVSSKQVSVQGEVIEIRASVAPMTYIITDSSGQIIQIDSNNSLDTTPVVFVGSVATGNGRELTPELYDAFREIVPVGTNRVGTLYTRGSGDSDKLNLMRGASITTALLSFKF